MFHEFPRGVSPASLPDRFPSPFRVTPHPLAVQAARLLQQRLDANEWSWCEGLKAPGEGKMFGVLVVESEKGLGYLVAFSGQIAGSWEWEGFVPPMFDVSAWRRVLARGEARQQYLSDALERMERCGAITNARKILDQLERERDRKQETLRHYLAEARAARNILRSGGALAGEGVLWLDRESQMDRRLWKESKRLWQERIELWRERLEHRLAKVRRLERMRARYSALLQNRLFRLVRVENWEGGVLPLQALYPDQRPPGGSGECAAPKLLHHAVRKRYRPIALAEFWWGAPPAGELRREGHFYPPCRAKCRPLLDFQLRGVPQESPPSYGNFPEKGLRILHEEGGVVVISKPAGLLSVPGKEVEDSVLTRLRRRYPKAAGPLLVHRLDMATSGLLVAALDEKTHKALQHQFEQRRVKKLYIAVLDGRMPEGRDHGTIDLPLRVDLDDRPRQRVCRKYGKPALTHYTVVGRLERHTVVLLRPITGRTHQLRVHCAHPRGLGLPIVGDELYGTPAERLALHAASLTLHDLHRANIGRYLDRLSVKQLMPSISSSHIDELDESFYNMLIQ